MQIKITNPGRLKGRDLVRLLKDRVGTGRVGIAKDNLKDGSPILLEVDHDEEKSISQLLRANAFTVEIPQD